MAVRRVQLRRGNTVQNDAFKGAEGEITVDTQTKSIRVHDNILDGGYDLMRADMSNNSAIATDINFTDANRSIGAALDGKTLTLGQANTTVRVPGTLTVVGATTNENNLLINDKAIVLADGSEGSANSTDSIGMIFTRTLDTNDPAQAQNPALFYWDEVTDRFRLEVNNITEANASWTGGAGADLTLANLYATTSVDVNNNNITNVGQIELDTITFADAGTVITVNLEDALNDKALTIKDAGNSEYLTINTSAESTTLGVPAKATTLRSNTITLGTDADNDVAISVAERSGDNAGRKLTISAGSSEAGGNNNDGGDLVLKSGGGDGDGTSDMEFYTKPSTADSSTLKMTLKGSGRLGLGTATPSSLLHISGADTSTLTLENTTGGNGQDDDPSTIQFIGNGQAKALAQIVGAHDGVADDDKGVLIFKPNNDSDPTEALRLDSALKATFAGAVEIATSLDLTAGAISNVTTIDLDKITDRNNDGIEIELQDGQASALVIDDTNGDTFLTVDSDANTITLGQATTLSSTLAVNGGSATIQGAEGGTASLFLKADESDDAGDDWRVQATDHATRTLTFAGENDAGNGYVDVLTLTGANSEAASSATVKGSLIVNGEIQSATDLVFQVDNDANGNNKFAFQAGDDTEVASLTEAGILTVTGLSNLNGGIAVDTDKFTVDGGGTGNTATKGTLTVSGNTVVGVAGEGSPNLSVINNAGNTTFSVTGATGATTVGATLGVTGITTLSSALNIVMDVADGILFNSDRDAEGDKDAALIKVQDSAGGTDGVLSWDDGLNTFSFSGSKLNSVLDFSVGTLASPSTTISATTGAIATAGTAPVLTLKNTTGGNDDGDSETQVIFQDDAGQSLAQIQGSHDGAADDTKGDLIFSTNSGGGLSEALRLDSANLATFAGSATVSGGTITVGGNGATIVATNANLLTITETTVATSEALTVGTNLTVGGNILGDGNEAKEIFTASADEASTITLGGGGTVISGGKLRLGSNIIENSASETTITLGTNQRTTLSGDLAVVGGATDGLTATTILLGASDANRDSAIKVVARTGANDGQDLTIEAGSTATDVGNQDGGDLILSSGGGDGTGTSNIILKTKISGSDTTTVKARLIGSGRLGLGTDAIGNNVITDIASLLHLAHATTPTITIQNTTGGNNASDRASTIDFKGETAAGAVDTLASITSSHDTGVANKAGKIVFSTFAMTDWEGNAINGGNGQETAVLTLDSTTLSTFAGSVNIAGNLTVSGDTTTVNTATLDVEDTVIRLNKGQVAGVNSNDIGVFFERGVDGNGDAVGDGIFYWDEGDDFFKLGTTTNAHTATDFGGATTLGGLQLATLELLDNQATALDIKVAGANISLLKFVSTDDGEKSVFGKIFEAPTGSKIGDLTIASGSITDSGNSISFGTNALTTSGLASLDGGIDVNGEVFTVSNAGATVIKNTLTLNNAGSTSDIDVQANGTSVFKVDVSANQAIINDGTLKVDKIQGNTDADDKFQLYLKDNTALGLVVSNVSDNVDFITVKTTTNSELITLAQATSISETLEVVGNATFDAEVHIETANANGIFFNQDGSGNASADATLITIEGGNNKDDVVLAWDTSDSAINLNAQSSIHLQGVAGGDALTIGGALKANAVASIETDGSAVFTSVNAGATITNAGAVSGVTSIAGTSMDITLTDNDADALDITEAGLGSYLLFDTSNAQAQVVVNESGSDIDFRVEGDGNANLIFARASDDKVGIKTANPAFDLDITGTLGVSGLADLNGGIDVNGSNFTVSNAGVVVSVGGITDTTTASAFATGTTIGNVTYSTNEIAGADGANLTIKSKQDIIFNIDSDNNDGAGKKFSFSHNANAEIASINDSGDLTLTGDATLNGGDLTVKNATAEGHAVISLISDNAGENGDTWKLDAADNTATLTVFNNVSGGDVAQLTLLGDSTATDGLATFAGNVKVNGTGTDALDFTANDITIGGSIAGNTLTLGASGSTVAIPGDLTVATTKSITLNSGAAGANADIRVNRTGGNPAIIRWVEANGRFEVDNATGSFSPLVNASSTIFTFDADGDENSIAITQGGGKTVTFQGANAGKNRGLDFTISGDSMILSFENDVRMPDSLIVDNILQVDGQLLVDSNDIEFDEANATIGAGTGANTITIGGATSTVAVAGSLVVNGTSIDVDGASALTVGATVGANNLTLGGATSTVVSAGDLKVEGNLVYDSSELTVDNASPAKITVTKPYHTVDTFGDAGTDDLEDIQGGATGMVVVLQLHDNARVTTLKHSTNGGNLRLSGGADFELNNKDATISLIYNGTTWCELTRSTNNA